MAEEIVLDLGLKTKVCRTCNECKPISGFLKHNGGYRYNCKVCHAAYTREWYKNNKEKRQAYYKDYVAKNPEKIRKHRDKSIKKLSADPVWVAKRKAWHTNWWLRRTYGISPEQWQSMLDAQGGLCALCRKRVRGRGDRLDVDHCHDTGRVRGLLCRHCNIALGILGDNPEKMERVMRYLRGD